MRSLPILPAHPDCEGIHFKVTPQLSRLDLSSEAKAYPPGQSTDALKGKQFISCLQKNMEPVAPSRHPLAAGPDLQAGKHQLRSKGEEACGICVYLGGNSILSHIQIPVRLSP